MIKKILNTKFKKDLSFSYITQAITMSFGFVQLFLINKYFGVNIYGQLAVIISTAGIFSSLLTARSSEAVTRFFKREELNKKLENAKFILFIGLSIDFITAVLLVVLIYSLSHFIAETFLKDSTLSYEIVIYSFITFFLFLRGSMFGYMQAKEMFVMINSINLLESILKILFLVLLILFTADFSLKKLILIFLMASFFSFVYTLYVFFKSYLQEYKNIKFRNNTMLLKEYWHFNVKTFLSSSLKAGNQNIDNLILAYFLNTQIVGIYQVIKKILSPILIISSPFSMLVYPKLIHFFETKQKNMFQKIIVKISFYLSIIALLYITIIYSFLDHIFSFMDVQFINEYSIYYLLISLVVYLGSMMWWVRSFSNTVNPNYSLYMNLFATIFQMTITISMTHIYGFYGMINSILIMNLILLTYWITKVNSYVKKNI